LIRFVTDRIAPTVRTRRRTLLTVSARTSIAFALIGCGFLPGMSWAQNALPAEATSDVPGAQWSGSARLRYFGFDVYDSRLWIGSGFRASAYAQTPLALELTYLRNLSGSAIAERSIKEMRRVGSISQEQETRWLKSMEVSFPDVKAGDRILGVHVPGSGARFWFNGQSRPGVADAEFSRYFFGIWLSDNTSEPKLRASLLERASP
jgi:hypothetical protein